MKKNICITLHYIPSCASTSFCNALHQLLVVCGLHVGVPARLRVIVSMAKQSLGSASITKIGWWCQKALLSETRLKQSCDVMCPAASSCTSRDMWIWIARISCWSNTWHI